MIVERRSFAPTAQVPLPDAARSALAEIGADLRDIPRDCLMDRMELLHWLRRLAKRVDGVAAMTTPIAGNSRSAPRSRFAGLARPATSREVAESVFRKRPPPPRTIVSRKGRSVRVETRRRPVGQFELEL